MSQIDMKYCKKHNMHFKDSCPKCQAEKEEEYTLLNSKFLGDLGIASRAAMNGAWEGFWSSWNKDN